jgi:transposase
VIPTKANEKRDPEFDKEKYRKRHIVENLIGWLKECRRIATRYEKNAKHYLGMLAIASIRQILRAT